MRPYKDRQDAGKHLARALKPIDIQRPVVVALPRGGVPVAVEIASALHAPLDLLIVRKLGVPGQPELAMGAIAEGSPLTIVTNPDVIAAAHVGPAEVEAVCKQETDELHRRRNLYLGRRPRIDLAGRNVVVVDDGIATGATVRAALRAVKARKPLFVVLALPAGARDTIKALKNEADRVVCLAVSASFSGVSQFYDDFEQVSDKQVSDALAKLPIWVHLGAAPQASVE